MKLTPFTISILPARIEQIRNNICSFFNLFFKKNSTIPPKSTKKIKGAKEGVYLVKNGSRFSSICNDVNFFKVL